MSEFSDLCLKTLLKFKYSIVTVAPVSDYVRFKFLVKRDEISKQLNIDAPLRPGRSSSLSDGTILDVFGDLTDKVFELFGSFICADPNINITCEVCDDDSTKYFLNFSGQKFIKIDSDQKFPISINVVSRGKDFIQSQRFIRKLCNGEKITTKLFIINPYDNVDPKISYESKFVDDLVSHLKTFSASKIVLKHQNSEERFTNIILHDYTHEFSVVNGKLCVKDLKNKKLKSFDFLNFMCFEISLKNLAGGLQKSLKSEITKSGIMQESLFADHIFNLYQIFANNPFYAPFMSLIQSSGFGKTKICYELLKNHPGIYLVFRESTDTGVPCMSDWMARLGNFIFTAPHDDFDLMQKDLGQITAVDYCTGRFLLGIKFMLQEYIRKFNLLNEGKLSDKFKRLSLTDSERKEFNSLRSPQRLEKIKELINAKICDCFFGKPTSESNFYDPIFDEKDKSSIKDVINTIEKLIMDDISEISNHNNFPFVIFVDEFDVFNNLSKEGRLEGLKIARRALHMIPASIQIMVVAIGTNTDALDFTPSVRDNSLRDVKRRNLLPPFILSGNWDIFDDEKEIKYHEMKLTPSVLLNRAFFNVLVSFGRALWSSCRLFDVMVTAQAKLKNGYERFAGARLALLLVRANLSVNVHHVLGRTLVRSYLKIIHYVSTDSKDMKISYSSEPVLAMASRTILKTKSVRVEAFQAIKEFLGQRAIDKGRLVEAIFEYLILFTIDDADLRHSTLKFTDSPASMPESVRQLCSCESHLLEIRDKDYKPRPPYEIGPSNYRQARKSFYNVITVQMMLHSLLGAFNVKRVTKYVSVNVLNALVNCNHFIQLERTNGDEFSNLKNFPKHSKTTIDVALLKMGLMRQCGFVMPPNYYGIDFIIPILIRAKNQDEGIYSFIGIQSKTCREDIYECAYKMTGLFHISRCPIPEHKSVADCNKKSCKACFDMDQIRTICENQLTLLLTARLSKPSTFPEIRVSSKDEIPGNLNRSKITNEAVKEIFGNDLEEDGDLEDQNLISSFDYPKYFSNDKTDQLKPDFILSNEIDEVVSLHKFVWKFDDMQLEEFFCKSPARKTSGKSKRTKLEQEIVPEEIGKAVTPFNLKLTCISINGVDHFEKFVTKNGISLIKEIVDFSATNFQNVDDLHLPIVQNSMLNGSTCPYPSCNKTIRRMRGLPPLSNPVSNYSEVFTDALLNESIAKCVTGPVDKVLDKLSDSYKANVDSEF